MANPMPTKANMSKTTVSENATVVVMLFGIPSGGTPSESRHNTMVLYISSPILSSNYTSSP